MTELQMGHTTISLTTTEVSRRAVVAFTGPTITGRTHGFCSIRNSSVHRFRLDVREFRASRMIPRTIPFGLSSKPSSWIADYSLDGVLIAAFDTGNRFDPSTGLLAYNAGL